MANHGPVYGLDAELAAKRAAQYDPQLEAQARKWVSDVTGADLGNTTDSLFTALQDGKILCTLVNKIKPGSVGKINQGKMPFMQMENINGFLSAARGLGLATTDLFQTVDLYERKNENQVVQCIVALGRHSRTVPGYNGPSIGPKIADSHHKDWSDEQLRAGEAEIGLLTKGQIKGASDFHQDNAYNPIKYTKN